MIPPIRKAFFRLLSTLSIAGLTSTVLAQGTADIPVTLGTPVPGVLTVEQAVEIALKNNPTYLQALGARQIANAARRTAFGEMLPQVHTSLGMQYQSGGRQVISGAELGASSDVLQSSYSVGISYNVGKATFVRPRLQRANSAAVEADIVFQTEALRSAVQQQFLSVLQSRARLALQDSLIKSAEYQVELAVARAEVGAGTNLDAQRARISLGQQQVQRLQAASQLQIDQLRLEEQLGSFSIQGYHLAEPTHPLVNPPAIEELTSTALNLNPGMAALRSREKVASLGVSIAKGGYLPTLSLSTGIGGYTYQYRDSEFPVTQARMQMEGARESCLRLEEVRFNAGLSNTYAQCNAIVFSPQQAAAIRSANSQFPFNFTSAPRNISAQLSLPIFDGFAREQRVQEARVQQDNARYEIRAQELKLNADITAAYLTLHTALQTVSLQQTNSAAARQEMEFTQEQYSVGLATFVDLAASRATFAQAESERINAIYDYHKAFAALESVVGRRLR